MDATTKISDMFADLLPPDEVAPTDRIKLEEIIERLQERGFGVLVVLLSLPSAIPGCPPPIPSLFALPLCFLAAQLALGYHTPTLPDFLTRRHFARTKLKTVLTRSKQYLEKMDALIKPRIIMLTATRGERILGFIMLLFGLMVMIPLPMTNTVPSIGIILIGIGVISRDGIVTIAGILVGFIWMATLFILSKELLGLVL